MKKGLRLFLKDLCIYKGVAILGWLGLGQMRAECGVQHVLESSTAYIHALYPNLGRMGACMQQ